MLTWILHLYLLLPLVTQIVYAFAILFWKLLVRRCHTCRRRCHNFLDTFQTGFGLSHGVINNVTSLGRIGSIDLYFLEYQNAIVGCPFDFVTSLEQAIKACLASRCSLREEFKVSRVQKDSRNFYLICLLNRFNCLADYNFTHRLPTCSLTCRKLSSASRMAFRSRSSRALRLVLAGSGGSSTTGARCGLACTTCCA